MGLFEKREHPARQDYAYACGRLERLLLNLIEAIDNGDDIGQDLEAARKYVNELAETTLY